MTLSPELSIEFPFESQFAEVGESQMHFVDLGEGETFLFVHGNPTWSFAWRRLLGKISEQNNAISIDHIGCGLSSKPPDAAYDLAFHINNLTTFIEQKNIHQITLVAHDWGGAIGMGAAARLPNRFARFVLCNTAAFRSQRIPKRIAACRIPLLGTFAIRGLNGFSRAALTMAVEKPLSRTSKKGFLAPYNSWANRVAVNAFVKDIPLRETHPSYSTLLEVENSLEQFVDHPMLLIWGEKDWCFTTDFLEEFERRFPKAETLRIPDAGHYVFEDAPDKMIERIQQFCLDYPLADSSK